MSSFPEVFLVGAAKSGSTAIYYYLKAHPEVFVPTKDANYMAFFNGVPKFTGPRDEWVNQRCIGNLEEYIRLYGARDGKSVAVDASNAYLYYPQASAKIAELCPQAKIVMVLRNPLECAFSMYCMMRRLERETTDSFEEAFSLTGDRMSSGWEWDWDYKGQFTYAKQVQRYLELFPSSQLFIRRSEELNTDPIRFYRDLTSFIGVSFNDDFSFKMRVNVAPRPIDRWSNDRAAGLLVRSLRKIGQLFPQGLQDKVKPRFLYKPELRLKPSERQMLIDYFKQDIFELSTLLNWNLDNWLV